MKIREPKVAGMFYPNSKIELEKMINVFFDNVELEAKFENVKGIISPHAGYIYSGQTAAFGYKTIIGKKFKNVIVISPSHREYFPGISIYDGDAYKTPLGEIKINSELRNQILDKSNLFFSGEEGHRYEHALEVQLPFLQIAIGEFRLIPIVIGDQGKMFVDELAEVLSNFIDDETLLVASSDLSHFYNREKAQIKDGKIVEHINKFEFEKLQSDLENNNCEACGGGTIVSIMKALKNKNINKSKVLKQTDSGDITGDSSEVVGYLSAIIFN
ncbi:MAG: AmmeMemoRadiSam system protein B [Ignavibacteriae bacterium]|nr:AmmeMemoRadiSam system protein B [Ignavibacteriota bacterium]